MRGLPTSSPILFSRLLSLSRRIPEHGFTAHSNPWIGVRCFSSGVSGSSSDRRRGPLVQYKSMVSEGKLKHDIYQEKVALELEELLGKLQNYEKEMEDYHVKLANWEKSRENERRKLLLEEAEHKQQGGVWIDTRNHRKSLIGKWISRRRHQNVEPGVGKMVSFLNREKKLDSLVGIKPVPPPSPKGIYLYGNVGSEDIFPDAGKTMLMDMFYSATEGIVKHRRRFHLHEDGMQKDIFLAFLLKLEENCQKILVGSDIDYRRLIPKTRMDHGEISGTEDSICESFEPINALDLPPTQVCTESPIPIPSSKSPPSSFPSSVSCAILSIPQVYSRKKAAPKAIQVQEPQPHTSDLDTGIMVYFFWPSKSDSCREYEETWHKITGKAGGRIISTIIPVMFGRFLEVPESCNGIARFDFEYLCGRPLGNSITDTNVLVDLLCTYSISYQVGAADYIAVARHYHTVFISNIPVMSMRIRDKARRFITLIDELYNHHCLTFCLADSSIDDLFQGTDEGTLFDLESFQFETEIEGGKLRRDVLAEGSVGSGASPSGIVSLLSSQEEMFAFRRAVSRLIEMQTPLYREGVKAFHLLFQQHHNNRLTRSAPVSYNPSL
ncbi:hypothetical protein ZIOFF_057193 [Zingiber officinale]|uniref:Uncharacterized protein n=1 Tax=Zingiber officinale TaxID=94328 RepID=A0A8J5FC49_ZINOF|nr:hypothetical protein ZIOFF_057193 [Zingiber officinale]